MRSGTLTLFIDTSSSVLHTGIVENDNLLIEVNESFEKDLSTYTLARIEEMFSKIERKPNDVDKIIVVNGPGSFTGIRIGITIAKTFAWALKKDISTISSLEAMAISTNIDKLKVPVIDARRDFVFAGVYDTNNKVVLENQYIKLDVLLEKLEELDRQYQIISNDEIDIEKMAYESDILQIVLSSKHLKKVNPHAVSPEYLKRTEAEENKGICVE